MINLLTKEQCVFIKKMFFVLYQGSQTWFCALYQGLKIKLPRGPNEDFKVTRGPHYDHQMVVDANVLQCLVRC